jgi:hypothetical protein
MPLKVIPLDSYSKEVSSGITFVSYLSQLVDKIIWAKLFLEYVKA